MTETEFRAAETLLSLRGEVLARPVETLHVRTASSMFPTFTALQIVNDWPRPRTGDDHDVAKITLTYDQLVTLSDALRARIEQISTREET